MPNIKNICYPAFIHYYIYDLQTRETYLLNNSHMSIRMITETINVHKESVRKILYKELRMKKVCAN